MDFFTPILVLLAICAIIIFFTWLVCRDTTNTSHRPPSGHNYDEWEEPWKKALERQEHHTNPKNSQIIPESVPVEHTITKVEKVKHNFEDDFPYMPYRKRKLLTYTEYQFYNIMKQACDEKNLLICPKVRLEDFVDVTDQRQKMKFRGYIKSRHVDFILTDSKLNILCGIELDDPSHQKPDAAKTDAFKNKLFRTIGVPLFRIDTTTKYEVRMNYIFRQLKIIPETQTYQVEQAAKDAAATQITP